MTGFVFISLCVPFFRCIDIMIIPGLVLTEIFCGIAAACWGVL